MKKSVDDKNLHIAQLMNKLETFTPGESSHVPTCQTGFDQRNKDVEESLAKSKFQKEKQSASVAALSIQQLQAMITNTMMINMVEHHKVSCITPSHIIDGFVIYTHRQTINHQSYNSLMARENPRQ